MKLNNLFNIGFILAIQHGGHSSEGFTLTDKNNGPDIDSQEAEAFYNSKDAPCNSEFWNKELNGTTRNEKLFEIGYKVIEIKKEYVLADCQPMTKIFDINRLALYFKDDNCTQFKHAACN